MESLPLALAIQANQAEPAPLDDSRTLLLELQANSEKAYETLVARFQQPVFSLVYRLLEDPNEAPDVVQDVFLKVFRGVGRFRGQCSLKTWIYRIAVNEAFNHRRWFGRHRRREVGLEDEDGGAQGIGRTLSDAGRSPYDYVFDRERQALIEDALSRINPNFRAAVVLRDISELSYEEIAEVLDVSMGTVKSRILRGREALRLRLTGRLESARRTSPARGFGWVVDRLGGEAGD
ncbi:MAG: sigma-70 family RNA polymerase sigma factor [Bryobacterales bacterium]|nr:sigma-70 family RNA polymerase sigma factor [Bryobacterales bacterium]